MVSFVYVDLAKLKDQYAEFQSAMQVLEDQIVCETGLHWENASGQMSVSPMAGGSEQPGVWSGMTYGRFTPGDGQFGRSTWLPEHFEDAAGDILDTNHTFANQAYLCAPNSFRQDYLTGTPTGVTVPGWNTIYAGAGANAQCTLEDIRGALAGWMIPSKSIRISKLRMEIGDKRYVIHDIEEMHGFVQPAIIYEEGFIIPEETHFLLRGFFEGSGWQRIIPLGFVLYRRKDSLLTE